MIIDLTDEEIVRYLVGATLSSERATQEVAAAIRRERARQDMSFLTPHQAGLISDIVVYAEKNGRLGYQHRNISGRYRCRACGESPGYEKFKTGPRRGKDNHNKPRHLAAVDLERSFVYIDGDVSIGCCKECFHALKYHLLGALKNVRAELPRELLAGEAPRFRWYQNRECTKCGWIGHEGEMGQKWNSSYSAKYPASCPSCKVENNPFLWDEPVKIREGFTVVEASVHGP